MRQLTLVVLLASTLLACGQPQDPAGPTADPSSSEPMSSTPPPTLTPPSGPPKAPSDLLKKVRVSGTVERGRHQGCVELVTAENVRYVLLGAPTDAVRAGDQVTVSGQPSPQQETRCQGIVLDVREIVESPE